MQSIPYGLWSGKIDPEMVANRGRISSVKWDKKSTSETLVFSGSKAGKSFLFAKEENNAPRQLNGEMAVGGSVGYGGGDLDVLDHKLVFVSPTYGVCARSCGRDLIRTLSNTGVDTSSPVISPDGGFAAYLASDGQIDQIALIRLDEPAWPIQWISGADFYMQPVWSPCGKYFAWAEWQHPFMPWQASVVKLAEIDPQTKAIQQIRTITGGEGTSASQPLFSPDGKKLSLIRGNSEWEDLVLVDLESGDERVVVHGDGFSLSVPAFSQGDHTYDWFGDSARIAYIRIIGTDTTLWIVNIFLDEHTEVILPGCSNVEQVTVSPFSDKIAAVVAGPLFSQRVIKADLHGSEVVYQVDADDLPESFISVGRDIRWTTDQGVKVYGVYYAPCNPDYSWDGLPPAIVYVHGGPTGKAGKAFSAETNYFTSLGYVYLSINYRGSHGYGKSYLDSLNGHWGEYDVEDTVTGAEALVKSGLVAPGRMLVTGGSAGGYTVLNSLIHSPETFAAGASLYGVSNLYNIVADTHKLELHYTDSLIGCLPEADQKFRDWSPLFHADQITKPLAIFQGDADRVVPPAQSLDIVARVKSPHVFRMYEGEGHGFRKPDSIRDYLTTMRDFCRDYI